MNVEVYKTIDEMKSKIEKEMTSVVDSPIPKMVSSLTTGNARSQMVWIRMVFVALILCFLYLVLFTKSGSGPDSRPNNQGPISSNNYWLESEVTIVGPEDVFNFNQLDSRLMNYLKARHLIPPSKLPYNFNGKYTKAPRGDNAITDAINKIFKDSPPGFFVECGGYDGIGSNTLFLEKDFRWSGLLIECNPAIFPELKKTHRKAFIADVCISVTENPALINISSMDSWPASSSVGKGDIFPKNIKSTFTRFEVMAFPLYSVIAATGAKVVDFITLDVQSIEWEVIKNFPFKAILVKVWIVEVVLLSSEDQNRMKSLMRENGYRNPVELGVYKDYLFVHNSVYLDPSIKSYNKALPPLDSYRGKSASP